MPTDNERMRILESLEKGEISPEEAAELLAAGKALPPEKPLRILERLEQGEISTEEAAERLGASKAPPPPRPHRRVVEVMDDESVIITPAEDSQDAWKVVLGIGVAIVVLSSAWMGYLINRSGMNFWFYCAWLPFALGVALTVFGWYTRNTTWLQLNVRDEDEGHHIYFTFPLPLEAVVRWFSRFGRHVDMNIDLSDDSDEH